jgi:zinc D-Ala-D-Ala dipeptidase
MQKFWLPIVVCSTFLISCLSSVNKTSKSNNQLLVISNESLYEKSVQSDSSKRMVLLSNYASNLIFDWRYATTDNFTKEVLYHKPLAYMRLEAAIALQKAAKDLELQGVGFKIFDAYRPYSVTKKMWEIVPDERYAANPAKGSGHNRGAAIDLTLYNLATGKELLMPTPFDDFTEKAHHDYNELSTEILQNRALLKNTLAKYGFLPLATEWWHYYLPNAAQRFEVMDLNFNQMKKVVR